MTATTGLNWFDVTLIVLALIGGLRGLQLGLSGQIIRLVGLAATVVSALLLRQQATIWLLMNTRIPPESAPTVALAGLLLAGLLLTSIARRLLRSLVTVTVTPPLERGGGFLGGLLRTALLLVLIVLAIHLIPAPAVQQHTFEQSVLGRWIATQVPLGYERLAERHPELRQWVSEIPVPIEAILQTNQTLAATSPELTGTETNQTATAGAGTEATATAAPGRDASHLPAPGAGSDSATPAPASGSPPSPAPPPVAE